MGKAIGSPQLGQIATPEAVCRLLTLSLVLSIRQCYKHEHNNAMM
jgi:hypothetical protein